MTIETISTYLEELQRKIDAAGIASFALNEDGAHNAAVIISMLRNASIINMFCGSASVFTESFFNNLSKDNEPFSQYSYVGDNNYTSISYADFTHNPSQDIGKYLRTLMDSNLHTFLSDNNKSLNIIIEDKNKIAQKTFLPALMTTSMKFRQNVKIVALENPNLVSGIVHHFSYAIKGRDNIFMSRIESDKRRHKADCIFYPPASMISSLETSYSNLKTMSSGL